ncbi:MAG TPA: hypothetical protein DCF33_12725 [Saprospirales bacterium]|nr:hypothetical protein [Saprospirales bacterium]
MTIRMLYPNLSEVEKTSLVGVLANKKRWNECIDLRFHSAVDVGGDANIGRKTDHQRKFVAIPDAMFHPKLHGTLWIQH